MKTLFKFDGFTVKSRISVTGDNYNQLVTLSSECGNAAIAIAGTYFKENEPTANIMQWAINSSKPNNLTL